MAMETNGRGQALRSQRLRSINFQGDSLVFAELDGRPLDEALRFAVAASALKQTIPGDFNRVSVGEVELLAAGDEGGRVRR